MAGLDWIDWVNLTWVNLFLRERGLVNSFSASADWLVG